MSARTKKWIVIWFLACITVLAIMLTVRYTFIWFSPERRTPYELPVGRLIEAQLEALGPQWSQSNNVGLYTDSDFTSGIWTVWLGFSHADYRYRAGEELHTFYNRVHAALNISPSPLAVNIAKNGYIPVGWVYVPVYADRFILDCSDGVIPTFCSFLLDYEEYTIVYTTDVAGAMTLDDLQRLIQATDEFMHAYLSESRVEPSRRAIPSLSELGLAE